MLSLPQSQSEFRSSNMTSASHPKKMYVFMANEQDVVGNPHNTPFNFKNYNLRSLILNVNGIEHREKADFVEELAMTSYHNLIRALGITPPRAFAIDYGNFLKVNTIWCFDVTPSNSANCESYATHSAQGTMWFISLEFASALPENAQLFILEEYEAILQFSEDGNVSIVTP